MQPIAERGKEDKMIKFTIIAIFIFIMNACVGYLFAMVNVGFWEYGSETNKLSRYGLKNFYSKRWVRRIFFILWPFSYINGIVFQNDNYIKGTLRDEYIIKMVVIGPLPKIIFNIVAYIVIVLGCIIIECATFLAREYNEGQ